MKRETDKSINKNEATKEMLENALLCNAGTTRPNERDPLVVLRNKDCDIADGMAAGKNEW